MGSQPIEIQAYEKIQAKRIRPWKGEEEVRLAWVSALESVICKSLRLQFDAVGQWLGQELVKLRKC